MIDILERIKCGNGNCYILATDDDAILVDTSVKKYRKKILRACEPYNIKLIVLTHGHIDHVQNAAYFAKEFNAPIAMHEADAELIADNNAQSLAADTLLGKIVLKVSLNGIFKKETPPFTPDILLHGGERLKEEYGIPAKILPLPGHTNGSIGIDFSDSCVIVGDALMNMFRPGVSLLYHDKEKMLKSATRIAFLGERRIFFGHGKPVYNKIWVK